MSDHKKPMTAELRQALIDHRLAVDTPSQLSDCFRHGWNAAKNDTTTELAELKKEHEELEIAYTDQVLRAMSAEQAYVAPGRGMLPQALLTAFDQSGMQTILDEHASEYGSGYYQAEHYPEVKKFAELIIRECANVVCSDDHVTLPTDIGTTYHPLTAHGYQLGKNILKHFGIQDE